MAEKDTRILALDFETSGLSSTYDQILQIGAAVMNDGEIEAVFYERIRPSEKFSIKVEALSVQIGSSDDELFPERLMQWAKESFSAPSSRDVFHQFATWAESLNLEVVPVVAHNAGFDRAFWNQWRFMYGKAGYRGSILSPVWVCTMEESMNHKTRLGLKKFGLDSVCLALGLPERPQAHDALQDAILCGQVYHYLRGGTE